MTDSTAYCIHCGAAIPTEAAFCRSCGKPQSAVSDPRVGPSVGGLAPATAGGVGPAEAVVTGRRSKTPLVILILAVVVVAVAAFVIIKQSSVSDAASVWCAGNADAVVATGRQLGVFPPDALPVSIGNAVFTVRALRANGISSADIDNLLTGDPSLIADWRAADAGSFSRACGAAFDAR